jgi:hypothetical protein
MNATAIEYIWQAILESERSDELQFLDREMLIMTAATRVVQPRPNQSGAVGREPIAEVAISPPLSALG